jgi:hypothetical protein
MNHRAAAALLARLALGMSPHQLPTFEPLTLRERLLELCAVVAMIYLTIVVLAP